MLFDLKNDPHETDNCADRSPQLLQHARSLLEQWQQAALKESPHGDPLEAVLTERA